jgi:hypothetical protein
MMLISDGGAAFYLPLMMAATISIINRSSAEWIYLGPPPATADNYESD